MFKLFKGRKPIGTSIDATGSDVDITPMLDVVFIMLIFFIVTASFVKESGIGLNKPIGGSNDIPESKPIIVTVDRDNGIRIQNVVVREHAIKATIVRLRAESPNSAVVVRLHPKSNTAAMMVAVDGIRSANVAYPNISMSST